MKWMLTVFCLTGALLATAGVDNVVVAFSTPGPDRYADGSQVVDGEIYALLWTPSGATFDGVAADGTAVAPSKLVLRAVAKGGRCPNVLFQIDSGYADEHFPNGTWSVVMLDTRKFAVDPKTKVIDRSTVAEVGGTVVNGYVKVASPSLSAGPSAVAPSEAVAAGATRAVPENAENLSVTDFAIEGDLVKITAKGAHPSMTYGLKAGCRVDQLAADAEAGERYGETDGTVTVYTPRKPGVRFYGISGR